MDEMIPTYRLFAGILGLLIGSFLNVVIHRLPLKKDLVSARSACPHCGYQIPWWLNIPVFAWLALRGKCHNCHGRIHWRYPLVELFIGVVFYLSFPATLNNVTLFQWVFQSTFTSILTCHFFIDLDHKLLLDKLNLYLLLLVLPFSVVFNTPVFWLVGGLVGFGAPYGVSWIFYKLKGKIGLGGGDIKLWGVLGIFLGPFGIIDNIFLSCLLGSLIGVLMIVLKRYDRDTGLPFGPFIIMTALIQMYFSWLPERIGLSLFSY